MKACTAIDLLIMTECGLHRKIQLLPYCYEKKKALHLDVRHPFVELKRRSGEINAVQLQNVT